MAELWQGLLANGNILFIVYFAAAFVVGIVFLITRKAPIGGAILIALAMLMFMLMWWDANFEAVGFTPLWGVLFLLLVFVFALLVSVKKK